MPAAASQDLPSLRGERWIAFPEVPGRREIAASHILALFQTLGLGDVVWTPVDSLTAQKRLVEAGFGIALLSQINAAEELGSEALSTISVRDLKASHDVVTVTRRGGFLSARGAPVAGDRSCGISRARSFEMAVGHFPPSSRAERAIHRQTEEWIASSLLRMPE